ncbi:hypothetical protein ABHF91_07035 [Pseudaeromonas sp. ZJS20]|uniref:hypothetical protein n=1 Tax=Pseudaeromonas aegiceratis TaxID=3153928 RepID=UPI00390CC1AB
MRNWGWALLLLLAACSKPLPKEKWDYVGEWRSSQMTLLILSDGIVAYKRLKKGGAVSINAPLRAFEGDDFEVGAWPFTTTFVVTEPPHVVDGHWQMVVDGVRLTKQGAISSI